MPQRLLECPPEPEPPVVRQDRDLALWVLDVRKAGAACRSGLDAVRDVVKPR